MPQCPRCSTAVPATQRFCGNCGTPVSSTEAGTATMTGAAVRRAPASAPEEGRFAPGTVLAQRYRISGKLGQGGMGEVYRATDLLLGQTVALKFLPPAATASETALTRFRSEVRTARLVSHPNVCRVFDIGEAEGLTYLSMEYVDGEDLRSLLHRIGRLPQDKALEIARKLCAGLAAAHDKGVIHRDLKPANIMLDREGQVRITDFGLAGFATQVRDVRSGTPGYMAPEQEAGKEVTSRSDIYALGVVLHEVFTGKRPSEGSKTELDPLVDRAIHLCLDPDSQRRPASALAVAAALPGGDPLAAALEAGETPSPGMVAAAGEKSGISVRAAVACFLLVLAGLVLAAIAGGYTSLLRRTPFENSTQALAHKAQDLIQSLGYTERPADRASGWEWNGDYRQYAEQKEKRQEYRVQLAHGQPSPIYFWFRQSPRPLKTLRSEHRVSQNWDPPSIMSGMVYVELDPQGRLMFLEAVPPEREERPSPPAAPDWTALFRAGGLDPARFTTAEPKWLPLGGFDTRMAWTGSYAHTPAVPLRVEAAAWRGKPVYFFVLGPWQRPWRTEPDPLSAAQRAASQVSTGLACVLLVAASLLAWRNLRMGRGDTRGASRLASFDFICSLLGWLCGAHHVPAATEVAALFDGIGWALLNAALTWALYMALEPYVRRRWPQSLIGWTRLLSGGIRDPLVGAQLLLGCAFGVVSNLFFIGWNFVFAQHDLFHPNPMLGETLIDTRHTAGHFFLTLMITLHLTLMMFFFFFLLRAVLRRQWLASAIFIVLFAGLLSLGGALPAVNAGFGAVLMGMAAFTMIRFGLLPLVAALFTLALVNFFPMTADLSAWYAGSTLFALAAVLVLAAYSFRTALAGRPLLKESFLEG